VTFPVEVVRSTRRKRTVGARMVGEVLRVSVPSWMSAAEEKRYVDHMMRRFERQLQAALVDLDERAAVLAVRYRLPHQGTPQDIASLVAFLAGPGGVYISGQQIAVDGGYLLT